MKETMAFIGGTGTTCPVLMKKLAQQGYRLLFVSNDEAQLEKLSSELGLNKIPGEIELVHCAKEGCWEADVIAFIDPQGIEKEVVERICEVATQKIVLCIDTDEKKEGAFSKAEMESLERSFPHSNVVRVKVNSQVMKAEVYGKKEEALQTIAAVFKAPGYETAIVKFNK